MNESTFAGLEMKMNAIFAAEPRDGFILGLEKQLLSLRQARTHFWQWWMRDLRQSRQARVAWTAVVVLFLAACIFATPQGRAWAQTVVRSLLGYFSVTDQNSLPLPETPRPLPTYSVEPALLPFEPKTTPAADPGRCGSALTLLTATPFCQMLNVQAEAGFVIKVFGTSTLPLTVDGVWWYQNLVGITYFSQDGIQSFHLSQGMGDFPPEYSTWGLVPADAVQQVVVGNHPGELVVGHFVNKTGEPTIDWSTWLPMVQLRWREGDHWYSMSGNRNYWTGDKVQADQLVEKVMELANSLVTLSADPGKMAGNLEQTPQDRAGFAILTPGSLPKGFELENIGFGSQIQDLARTVIVTYGLTNNGQWAGGISLYETPATNNAVNFVNNFTGSNIVPKYVLRVDEQVRIGQAEGRYMVKSGDAAQVMFGGATALIWEHNGMQFMLHPYYGESVYGGRFSRDTLIAIAESLR